MGVVPFSRSPPHPSVVLTPLEFSLDGRAVLIVNPDMREVAACLANRIVKHFMRGDKHRPNGGG